MLKNSKSTPSQDIRFIKYTLALARKGYAGVFPNPPVGAVLVKNNRVLAADYHKKAGLPHAERLVIEACPSSDLPGSTLYVSLEPCCHHGKTPPCTDAIIESGISRVVFGADDMNHLAAGGADVLLEHGIQVERSAWSDTCSRFIRPWQRWILEGRKSLDVFLILSLNGLIFCGDSCESAPLAKAKSLLDRSVRRTVQSVISDIDNLDAVESCHAGYIPGSPEDLRNALEHSCFSSLMVIRVPVFASESVIWKSWSAEVSLLREYVRKSGLPGYEQYMKV